MRIFWVSIDWQYAEVSMLVGETTVGFGTRLTAIVKIDITALGGPITHRMRARVHRPVVGSALFQLDPPLMR